MIDTLWFCIKCGKPTVHEKVRVKKTTYKEKGWVEWKCMQCGSTFKTPHSGWWWFKHNQHSKSKQKRKSRTFVLTRAKIKNIARRRPLRCRGCGKELKEGDIVQRYSEGSYLCLGCLEKPLLVTAFQRGGNI